VEYHYRQHHHFIFQNVDHPTLQPVTRKLIKAVLDEEPAELKAARAFIAAGFTQANIQKFMDDPYFAHVPYPRTCQILNYASDILHNLKQTSA